MSKFDRSPQISAPAQARNPLFYQEPAILRFEEHAGLALSRKAEFGFAAKTNALPAVAGEFMVAQKFYPIVFAGAETPAPVLITGLEGDRNLYLEDDHRWRRDTYIPAYVRRYPFNSTIVDEDTQLLCADLASNKIVKQNAEAAGDETGTEALFDADGQATPATRSIMDFCKALHEAFQATESFSRALDAAGLLVEKHADIEFADKSRFRLDGFRIVDVAAFRALSADTLADWTRKGWVDLIVLHLASQQNWHLLLELHASQKTA